MKKFTLQDGMAAIVWLIPLVYLFTVYPALPDSVPVHFGLDGQPDRYGSRNEFLWVVVMFMAVSAIMYLLFTFLPFIDPKRKARYSSATFKQLAFVLLIFMSAINIVIMYTTHNGSFNTSKLMYPLMGLLFTYLGNIMHSLKPNYFVGIRTPWTLESEATWRKTHQLAAKIWLPGGILITLLALLLPAKAATIAFIAGLSVMIIIPVIFSYKHFKKHSMHQS